MIKFILFVIGIIACGIYFRTDLDLARSIASTIALIAFGILQRWRIPE